MKTPSEYASPFTRSLKRAAASGNARTSSRSAGRLLRAWLHNGDGGQSMVEVALLLPIVMMMLTGIFSVGVAYVNLGSLQTGVNLGASDLAGLYSVTSDPCADTFAIIASGAQSFNPAKITVTYYLNAPTSAAATGTKEGPFTGSSANSCSSIALTERSYFSIYALYPCNIGMYGISFSSSCELPASGGGYVQ